MPALLKWFSAEARDLPWRRTSDPYGIWVSEIMLQQTQVKTVIPYWERWMRELPDIRSLAATDADKIHKLWEGLGYYTRARNLQKAARLVVEKHGGVFPESFEDILALPGIGRYTAGAISSIAFNQPAPILDGNVIRVLTRVFGIAGNPREKTTNARLWHLAENLVREADRTKSASACSHLNQSLMELGALVCTPRSPACPACPLQKHCVACREHRVAQLPNLPARAEATPRRFAAFIWRHRDRIWLQQRPAGVVNAHLWEFPNVEVAGGEFNLAELAKKNFSVPAVRLTRFCTITHRITRYRITLEAYRAESDSPPQTTAGSNSKKPIGVLPGWVTFKEANSLALASAHRKVLDQLMREKTAKKRGGIFSAGMGTQEDQASGLPRKKPARKSRK